MPKEESQQSENGSSDDGTLNPIDCVLCRIRKCPCDHHQEDGGNPYDETQLPQCGRPVTQAAITSCLSIRAHGVSFSLVAGGYPPAACQSLPWNSRRPISTVRRRL